MTNHKQYGSSDLRKTKSQLIQEMERLRRELEDARKSSSERKYQDLTEGSLQGYYIHDDFELLSANQAMAEMFGYGSVEELQALDSVLELYTPEIRAHAMDINTRRKSGEDIPERLEFEGLRKDGTTLMCETLARMVNWDGRKAIQITMVDITERLKAETDLQQAKSNLERMVADRTRELEEEIAERKEAEEELRKGDAIFRGLAEALESISEGFSFFDENDQLVYSNSKMKQLFGSVANLLEPGVPFADIIRAQIENHPLPWAVGKEEQYLAERMEGHMNPGDPIEQEFESGEIVLLKEYRTQSGGFVSIRTDITELKHREKELTEKTQRLLEEIAERKRAEEELRESEKKFRALVEGSVQGIVVHRGVDLIFANQAFADMYGYRNIEEILALESIEKINVPEEREWLRERGTARQRGEEVPVFYESKGLKKDGAIIQVTRLNTVIEWEGEAAILTTLYDITEHKRAEDALRESEEKYRNLVEGSIQSLIIHTDKLLFANQAAATLFGYDDPEEMQELETIGEIFSPEDRESMAEKREARMRDADIPNQYEFQGLRKDGTPIWVETHVRIVNWEGQQAIQCTYSDISERKRAEVELRESEERFKSIFDNSPSLILLKDVEGRYLLVSDRHEEWHGIPAADMIGKTANDLFTRETADNMWAQDQEVLRTGQASIQEQEVTRLDGSTIRVVITKFPVRNGSGAIVGIGTIANDVTDQRTLEAQLRESQKMEAVGQLAGGIAHDFNNLLQIINIYAHLVLDNPGDGEKSRKHIRKIIEAGERAANLTRQLLTFSRKTVLRQTSLDLNDLISHLINMVGRIIGEDIELNFMPSDPLHPVLADPGMIEQVVLNLCVNARDAMPDGGRLDLSTRNLVADRELCDSLGLEHPGSYIMLEVRDTGTGMAGEVREHIFEPFFTTKEVGKGTGLGLSMAHGIVQQHQGAIDVRSEPRVGTTFTIYLPAAEAEPLTDEKKAPIDSMRGRETILVAEDEAEVRELLSDLLRSQGYRVLAASDGREAVDLFRAESASIDLVILDVVMPKLKGPEVHDFILQMRPEVPVVFSTGYLDQVINADYMNRHGLTLIQKPYTPCTLFNTVRETLDRTE